MKREKLVKYLNSQNCHLKRHVSRHDVFLNRDNGKKAPVPRHREINEFIVNNIKKQLSLI